MCLQGTNRVRSPVFDSNSLRLFRLTCVELPQHLSYVRPAEIERLDRVRPAASQIRTSSRSSRCPQMGHEVYQNKVIPSDEQESLTMDSFIIRFKKSVLSTKPLLLNRNSHTVSGSIALTLGNVQKGDQVTHRKPLR